MMEILALNFLLVIILINSSETKQCVSDMKVDNTSSQYELMLKLTNQCQYDNLAMPEANLKSPVKVTARIFIYNLQMRHTRNVAFRLQMLIQFWWVDKRLSYHELSALPELVIDHRSVLEKLWVPHVFIANAATEQDTRITSSAQVDQVGYIKPHGQVLLFTRIWTELLCQQEKGNFPFDYQDCLLIMDNWRNDLSHVVLQWELKNPIVLSPSIVTLTEFNLIDISHHSYENSSVINEGLVGLFFSPDAEKSSLVVNFRLARKFGFYFWDYYVPSVLLVVMSWGSFWINPEVIPARIWLATCTMLGFFGLGAMNDAMPQMSHLKINDIWFIGCNLFIFLSLAEFALVNLVHRQATKHIPLKRISSKYILKSSLKTESLPWKLDKANSCPSSPELRHKRTSFLAARRRQQKNVAFNLAIEEQLSANPRMRRQLARRRQAYTGEHMTNVEMAIWIDCRSRFVFPIAFLVFNLFFWTLMFL